MKRATTLLLMLCAMAAAPATQPRQELAQWVNELGDGDATVRRIACDHLMDLNREQLPELAEAMRGSGVLLPGQVSQLHDIVLHVFLSAEPYPKPIDAPGFLGVKLAASDEVVTLGDRQLHGVRIMARWPGFSGFRYLQDGDLILKVDEFPETGEVRMEFPMRVRARHPGEKLTLQVLRRGELITVAVPLDARPKGEDEQTISNMMQDRLQKAEAYWAGNFAGNAIQ